MTRLLLLAVMLVGCGETETLRDPPMFSVEAVSPGSQPEDLFLLSESEDGTQECLLHLEQGEHLELRVLGCRDLARKIEI